MLKAHSQWRRFYRHKLDIMKADFGSDTDGLLRKTLIINELKEMEESLANAKLFKGLAKGEAQTRQSKLKSVQILNPEEDHNQKKSVKVFLESKFYEEEEHKMTNTWEKANQGKKIGKKEFDMASNFTRFNLHLENKNRGGAYKFTNEDYASKFPKWLPEGVDPDEMFQQLPDGWNPEAPPPHEPDMRPTGYVIEIFGDTPGIKNQTATSVVISRRMEEMIEKYRDIKAKVIDKEDPKEELFVNSKGEPLGPMKNWKGSLLDHFTQITGVARATVNTARRAATSIIQADPYLKSQESRIQHHSDEVAITHYDKGGPNLKMQVTQFMSRKDGIANTEVELSEEVKINRRSRADRDKELKLNSAKDVLLRDKLKKRASKLSKTCRALPEQREFFQQLFKSQQLKEVYEATNEKKFPGKYIEDNISTQYSIFFIR